MLAHSTSGRCRVNKETNTDSQTYSMMDLRVLLVTVVLVLGVQCVPEPTYVVSAPKQVNPLSTYTVIISLHNSEASLQVKANLSGPNPGESDAGEVTVNPGESKTITLQVGDWKTADSLAIEGSGAANFSTSQRVNFNSKKSSLFVQTDKAIYQPGQKVQFRVFVVDIDMKPVEGAVTIYISDPQRNRIKQYLNASLEKGVFSGDLQLSDRPLLGDWDIEVQAGPIQKTKSVTVEEYVLPTYEVSVTPPAFATYNYTSSLIRVAAKYTFGKPVHGSVVLYVSDDCQKYRYYNECNIRPNISATLEKNGQVVIPLDVSRIRYPPYHYNSQNYLDLLAIVTEELTGKTMNASARLAIYPREEKLELTSSPDKFRPGLPIELTATVSDQDNKPLVNPDAPVNFTITYQTNNKPITENKVVEVPANGIIRFQLSPPAETKSMSVQANYKDADSSYLTIGIAPSLGKKYIAVELRNSEKTLTKGTQATFCIKTTFKFDQVSYEVVSGGDVVDGGTVKVTPTNLHEISLNVTHEMTPRARLIVYAVTDCGEILCDSIDYQVDGFFRTPVALSANPNETEPGGAVSIVVETSPSAMVYLLGIDQSVLLLKSGNDITKREVEQDFAAYDSSNAPYYGDFPYYRRWYWRPPTQGVERTFQDAGLIFYSNALYQKDGYCFAARLVRQECFPQGASSGPARPTIRYTGPPTLGGSARAGAIAAAKEPELRKFFPETWIWHTLESGPDGRAVFNTTAPDTITSWRISPVVLDDVTGLGLSDTTATVTVFRPFFATLNLPYSVVRGETLKLQALVFNYLKGDVQANVTLFNDDGDFEFVDEPKDAKSQSKSVSIPSGETVSAVFPIKFKKVGYNKIKVSAIATSPIAAGDALQKELLVKAEGTTKYFNKAVLVDLRQKRSLSESVDIKVPDDVVPDSEHVDISVVGDIMGPAITNIDNLLRMPYGCGEQNMINFVPNIVVANYLEKIGQLTSERKAKAVSNIEAGYQRQLNYKHFDGSFSAFGNSDVNGSTWLTAYVIQSFAEARPFVPISESILNEGLSFLNKTQLPDGTFVENGKVSHKAMQGGAETGLAMTAYILITFLTVGNPAYNATVAKAVKALENRLPNAIDPYEVAVITYALHKANSPSKDAAFTKLKNLATTEGELIYWKKLTNGTAPKFASYETDSISSLNVESTAYSVLSYANRNLTSDAIPPVRWLVGQRSENGGFASTQDTVVGLKALASIAGLLVSEPNSAVDVDFKYGGRSKRFSVTKDSTLLLQQATLPPDTQLVEIEANGNGVCVAQVTWSYNVINLDLSGTFTITAEVKSQTGDSYQLYVCAKYTDKDGESSNMAIIQLNSLSGYTLDKPEQRNGAKKVEHENGNTRINLYYDEIDGSDTCVTVTANRNNEIENLKQADVVVYDYYQKSKKATTRYNVK